MHSLKLYHTTMMNEALLKDDIYLANTHHQALIRLDDCDADGYLGCNRIIRETDQVDLRKESMKCYQIKPAQNQPLKSSVTLTGLTPHQKKGGDDRLNVTIYTGAGISAESGVPTFRDTDGVYANYPLEIVTSVNGWDRDRDMFMSFWDHVKSDVASNQFKPNAAHHAIAELQNKYSAGNISGDFKLITTNVDGLHEDAGSTEVLKVHGDLLLPMRTIHMDDGTQYQMPDVVLFGEATRYSNEMWNAINNADLFIVVGSSLSLGGDSAMVYHAKDTGSQTVEVNTRPTGHPSFDKVIEQPAATALPSLIESISAIAA